MSYFQPETLCITYTVKVIWILRDLQQVEINIITSSDGSMIDYNQKLVGLDSWTDDQAQS